VEPFAVWCVPPVGFTLRRNEPLETVVEEVASASSDNLTLLYPLAEVADAVVELEFSDMAAPEGMQRHLSMPFESNVLDASSV
jgi:hypothetical protein